MTTPLRRYYRGHTLAALREQPVGGSATKRYYHFDHQGTTQCLTEATTGAITHSYTVHCTSGRILFHPPGGYGPR